jgi:hypothetical protein
MPWDWLAISFWMSLISKAFAPDRIFGKDTVQKRLAFRVRN